MNDQQPQPPWAYQPKQWPTPEDPYGPYHQQPKPKRKKWPWIVGGFVALVVIGALSTPAEETPVPPVAEATQQSAPAKPVPAEPAAPTYEAPVPSYPTLEPGESYTSGGTAGIGDGTHIIGEDMEPGTYKSAGAQEGFFEFCSWSTKKGPSSNSDVIDFGTANANEQMIVEIGPSVKAFTTNNCEPWVKTD